MPNSVFDTRALRDEQAAYSYVETRIWASGRVCPHCGVVDRSGKLENQRTKPSKINPEGKLILGLYKCYACRKPFTVKIGTIFEDSHAPMHLWLQAIVMMCASKKGISSNQLHRVLGVTLRTAWHMSHRIRLAMAGSSGPGPLGGEGQTLEVDETFFGKKEDAQPRPWQFSNERGWHRRHPGYGDKVPVVALVERGGRVRTFRAENVQARTLRAIILENADPKSALNTDENRSYERVGKRFATHRTVNHKDKEWVRHEDGTYASVNAAESYFSVFKRGMVGVYQHCDERHLHRYLAEFDFRHNTRAALGINDTARTEQAVLGAVGKRLTYRGSRSQNTKTPTA